MTGSRDAAAAEEAQLRALREEADRRRSELGGTVQALAGHAVQELNPRAFARHGMEAAKGRVSGVARDLARWPADAAKERAYRAAQALSRRPTATFTATLAAMAGAGAFMYWVIWGRKAGAFPSHIRAGVRARNGHRRRGFLRRRGGDARRFPA